MICSILPRRSVVMVHQIGRKLREQIHRFSGGLCTKLEKVASGFIEEMIYDISASGSVVLTKMARASEESMFNFK